MPLDIFERPQNNICKLYKGGKFLGRVHSMISNKGTFTIFEYEN
jgi:hypothetical protein